MAEDRNNVSENKVRVNLTLSQETLDQGEAIRSAERRNSFSNVVEWLCDLEWKRRFQDKPPVEPEATQNGKAVVA